VVFLCALLILAVTTAGLVGFREGVRAASPGDSGTYLWTQLSSLGLPTAKVSFAGGRPLCLELSVPWTHLLYFAGAAILGGRLWRAVTRRRPRGSAV
jgi:hypothetical protein